LQEDFDRFNNALYKEKEMADFRRCFIALAALALLFGAVSTVSAQPFTCQSTAPAVQMRAEGLTEKGGDFVLTCTGGTPIAPGFTIGSTRYNDAPTVNIQVFLNTNVTSRILTSGTGATDALLLIDEPPVGNQNVCTVPASQTNACPVAGLGASAASPYLQAGAFNVWQGQWLSTQTNSIIFNGVPIAPPGTMGGNRIFRITNIRADANALGVVANGTPLGVTETLTSSNPSILPISSNNASQTIGSVQQGLIVTTGTATNYQQCTSETCPVAANTVTLNKGFARSFEVRSFGSDIGTPSALNAQDTPGVAYNTETFFYNPALLGGNAGTADFGTRLRIVFNSVNAGVTVWVPVDLGYDTAATVPNEFNLTAGQLSSTTLSLYAHLTSSEAGSYAAVSANGTGCSAGWASISVDSTGKGEAIYEVLRANTASSTENFVVPITISYTANPGQNIPALGTSTVGASFAPVSTVTVASSSDPIPRFADTSKAVNDFTISKCATHLLFPFVTNQAGFDTGMAISNTSQDPYGTSTQTGTCTLNFYGASAPAAFTTPANVDAGTTWTTTALAVAPGFQGYVIADCQFQYAHGFAFVTRVGAVDVAMGYLALIIPDPPRAPNGFDKALVGAGEMLGE
jgi:hypothetical protein